MIHGNLEGIRRTLLDQMEELYALEVPRDQFLPIELARTLAQMSARIRREISLYISRGGEVLDVTIGGLESVPLSDMRLRRNLARLAGLRCVHTHPGGDMRLSDVDVQALVNLRLDAMASIGIDDQGEITGVQAAFLGPCSQGIPSTRVLDPVAANRLPQQAWMQEIETSEQAVRQGETAQAEDQPERAMLLGIEGEQSLEELAALAETAGAVVIATALQKRDKPDSATYIGTGRASQVALEIQAQRCDLVIVDDELSGAQTRNLEELLGTRVVDRTTLILDIFAQRARSREGKLQVEIAQMSYQLPRLMGQGVSLSRLGGGIGTRGPGESKLEMGRRRIRERMTDLRRELDNLSKQRDLMRSRRQKQALPTVALVGYTNTGKSTLLNAITDAGVLAEDMLFATLDPVTRRVGMEGGGEFLLVDTVGFIRKLPTALVDAFRSTLEEAALADLLLVVSDASAPDRIRQRQVVDQVLGELGAGDKPVIEVINKCDLGMPEDLPKNAAPVSGKTGFGLPALLSRIAACLQKDIRTAKVLVPYAKGQVLSMLHEDATVVSETYEAEGTLAEVRASAQVLERAARILGPGAI
ncbi:MAG TPA: GTPase HflX, partial [Clostridia bacterium]|nr:GTPase HflX [Clostridia bacterium]